MKFVKAGDKGMMIDGVYVKPGVSYAIWDAIRNSRNAVDVLKVTCGTCHGEWWSGEPSGTACGLRDCTGSLQEKASDDESGNAALRAEIADLRNEVEQLQSRVAYLESKRAR